MLYLVRTKASELADFPGVNTPLNPIGNSCACWFNKPIRKAFDFYYVVQFVQFQFCSSLKSNVFKYSLSFRSLKKS